MFAIPNPQSRSLFRLHDHRSYTMCTCSPVLGTQSKLVTAVGGMGGIGGASKSANEQLKDPGMGLAEPGRRGWYIHKGVVHWGWEGQDPKNSLARVEVVQEKWSPGAGVNSWDFPAPRLASIQMFTRLG